MVFIRKMRFCAGLIALCLSTAGAAAPSACPSAIRSTALHDAAVAPSDIDYAHINQLLTAADAQTRLQELPGLLRRLDRQNSDEDAAVSAHLRLALAQSQRDAGELDAAAHTLRAFPLADSRAPDALLLMADIALARQQKEQALRWLQQVAIVFPEQASAVRALLYAARLSSAAAEVLRLNQQASSLADAGLAQARFWQQRSLHADFWQSLNSTPMPAALWQLAQTALVSQRYNQADSQQQQAAQALSCLQEQAAASQRLLQKNPVLLADLAQTVAVLDRQLLLADAEVQAAASAFLATAQALQQCRQQQHACQALQEKHDAQGKALTAWRNRLRTLAGKNAYLQREQSALLTRWRQENAQRAALLPPLLQAHDAARALMQAILQAQLKQAVYDWEELAAQAHWQLAQAQDPYRAP